MRNLIRTLKIGLSAVLVGAVVMSGIAFAQTDEDVDVTETPAYSRIVEALGPLVEQGVITGDQAASIAEALAADARDFGRHRRAAGHAVETAAEVLGMEVEDLVSQLREGATLAEIAGDQADEVEAALLAEAEERLAQAVADGRITEEEAEEKLTEIEERISNFMNGEYPERRPGKRGPRGFGRGPGGPGFGQDAPATDAVNA